MNWRAPRTFKCPECGKKFELKGAKLRVAVVSRKKNPDKKGPFCSVKCVGKYFGKKKKLDKQQRKLKATAEKVLQEIRKEKSK